MNQQTQKRLLGIASLAVVAIIWQIIAEYVVGRSFILPTRVNLSPIVCS